MTDEVQQIIEFAKFVPGFISLLQDDQIMLLKGGLHACIGAQLVYSVLLTCRNGVSPKHLPVIVASDRP